MPHRTYITIQSWINKVLRKEYDSMKIDTTAKQRLCIIIWNFISVVSKRAKELAEDSPLGSRHLHEALPEFFKNASLNLAQAFAVQKTFLHTTGQDTFIPKEPKKFGETHDRATKLPLKSDLMKELKRVKNVMTKASSSRSIDDGIEMIAENLSSVGMAIINNVVRRIETNNVDLDSARGFVLEVMPETFHQLGELHAGNRLKDYEDGTLRIKRKKPSRRSSSRKRGRSKTRQSKPKARTRSTPGKRDRGKRVASKTRKRKRATPKPTKTENVQSKKPKVSADKEIRSELQKNLKSRAKTHFRSNIDPQASEIMESHLLGTLRIKKKKPSRRSSSRKRGRSKAKQSKPKARTRSTSGKRDRGKGVASKTRKRKRATPKPTKIENVKSKKPKVSADREIRSEFQKNLRTWAKTHFRSSVHPQASEIMESHLLEICCALIKEIEECSKTKSSVSEEAVSSAIRKLFPKTLAKHALASCHGGFLIAKAQQQTGSSGPVDPETGIPMKEFSMGDEDSNEE